MDVYRIGYRMYAKDPLDGEGSFLYGGRWSSPGTRMAYTSTTLTLAMAEFLAHVNMDDLDPDTPPALVYVRAMLPDAAALTIEQIGMTLPDGWDNIPAPAVDSDSATRGPVAEVLWPFSRHPCMSLSKRQKETCSSIHCTRRSRRSLGP